jgi:hypothetical protein
LKYNLHIFTLSVRLTFYLQDFELDDYDCSFNFLLEVGVEESIVNAPLVSLQSKNTNNAKSKVRFKQ